jgi:uncharacterized repeat protein (TIGR01451 family)
MSTDLSLTNTDDATTAVPGNSTTYTITVSNTGASTATDVAVDDPIPAGVASFVWSGDGHTNVSGAIADTVATLAPGASVIYTLTAAVDPSATGDLINTATVTPSGGTPTSARDTDTLTPQNDVAVTNTDGVTGAVPGNSTTYTITVSNTGPSTATNVAVDDPIPAGVTSFVWSGAGHTNVSGPIADTVASLAPGASVVYSLTAEIDPSATADLSNTATVTAANDTGSGNNSATDTDTLTPQADLAITTTDGVATAVPGTSTTYTITVSNSGPSTATSVAVADPIPTGFTSFTWSGNGHTNVSGAINDTVASLAPGASVTYTLTAGIDPAATGSLVNTATVTAANDTGSGNNSSSDTDTLTPENDVSISNTDNALTAVPGPSTIYTITVGNAGPSTATNIAVTDTVPAGASFIWSGNGHTNMSGAINDTVASLAPGASVVYTLVAQIDPSATGSLTNTATVSAANDTNSINNSGSDTDTLTPQNDVSITNTDSVTSAVPGAATTYTITVSNNGRSTATNIAVADPIPDGVTSFIWSGNGHSNVSGAINDTVASLAPGTSVVYTLTAELDPTATGPLTDTATVSAANDINTDNNSASDTDTLTPQADLTVSKSDGKASVVPGASDSYTITVSNSGPSTVNSVQLTDLAPAALLNPVFGTPSAGSYDPGTARGAG